MDRIKNKNDIFGGIGQDGSILLSGMSRGRSPSDRVGHPAQGRRCQMRRSSCGQYGCVDESHEAAIEADLETLAFE
jgi:hypothetical protein